MNIPKTLRTAIDTLIESIHRLAGDSKPAPARRTIVRKRKPVKQAEVKVKVVRRKRAAKAAAAVVTLLPKPKRKQIVEAVVPPPPVVPPPAETTTEVPVAIEVTKPSKRGRPHKTDKEEPPQPEADAREDAGEPVIDLGIESSLEDDGEEPSFGGMSFHDGEADDDGDTEFD